MIFAFSCTIPANHPSLPGHFPDEPIVPGVVILDEVAAAVINWRSDSQLTGISVAKFLARLKPGQLFHVDLTPIKDREMEIDFRCRVDNRTIAEGRLTIAPRAR